MMSCKGGPLDEKFVCCKFKVVENTPLGRPKDKKWGIQAIKNSVGVKLPPQRSTVSALSNEFPWTIAIFKKTFEREYEFWCSGSLIRPKAVLTANHCVLRGKPSDFVVEANPKNKLTGDEEKRRGVWGTGSDRQRSDVLRRVQVPIVDNNSCQDLLRKAHLGDGFKLHTSFMCAGGEEGKDARIGDGGAALACPMPSEDNRYFQAGIVSWGIGCGRRNIPGVYASVHKIADWIRDEIQSRRLIY